MSKRVVKPDSPFIAFGVILLHKSNVNLPRPIYPIPTFLLLLFSKINSIGSKYFNSSNFSIQVCRSILNDFKDIFFF